MYQDEKAKDLVRSIQKQCAKKFKNSWGGIKAISVLFRGLDKDYSKRIDEREFIEGMIRFNIDLTRDELRQVFRHFDKDRNGSIDFREFLNELMPPMPSSRRGVIKEAFDKLDVVKDGVLKMDDLRSELFVQSLNIVAVYIETQRTLKHDFVTLTK
jgi:Ca2+-binding EF-hand superfamily protein